MGQRRLVYRLTENHGVTFGTDSSPAPGTAYGTLACTPGGAAPAGTAFADKGAPKLRNVNVVLIYWGKEWAGPAGSALAGQVTNAVQNLLAGPYMSYLVQYGIHRGRFWGQRFVNSEPPNPFAYSDVGNFVISQLDADNLPEPDSDWPLFFCVIMPTTVAFQGDSRIETVPLPPGTISRVVGANSQIIWNDYDLGDVDNDPAYYAWIGNNGTLDYITTVLSHELVEICSDPNQGNGIVQVTPASVGGASQIGDPCTSLCGSVRGVKVQSYWSQLDGACVIPALYSVRRTLADRNINGKLSSLGQPINSLNALISSLF